MTLTIEKLQNDLVILNQRKEQAVQNFHQVIGAISILEQMISLIEQPDDENLPVMDVLPVEEQAAA